MLRTWGFSLAIHVLLLVLLLGRPPETQPRLFSLPVQLDVSTRLSGKNHSPSGQNTPSSGRNIPLASLGVSYGATIRGWIQQDTVPGTESGGGALGASDRNISLYQYLFHTIDQFTGYPAELKYAGITGRVLVKLYIDARGEFRRELSEVRATSPYLKVAVIRGIKSSLAQGLPASLRKNVDHPFSVQCEFTYEQVEHDDPEAAQQHQLISAKALAFYRYFPKSKLEWQLGPLSGFGIIPSIAFNPLWFVAKISDALSKKAKIDPLEHYRDDPEW